MSRIYLNGLDTKMNLQVLPDTTIGEIKERIKGLFPPGSDLTAVTIRIQIRDDVIPTVFTFQDTESDDITMKTYSEYIGRIFIAIYVDQILEAPSVNMDEKPTLGMSRAPITNELGNPLTKNELWYLKFLDVTENDEMIIRQLQYFNKPLRVYEYYFNKAVRNGFVPDVTALLEAALTHFNVKLEIVKFLVEKGAVVKRSQVERARLASHSITPGEQYQIAKYLNEHINQYLKSLLI